MACEALGSRLRALESVLLQTCKQNFSFGVVTVSGGFTEALSIPVADGQVAMIDFEVVCRSADGAARAAFKRTGLFYREGGAVQIQRIWHTMLTEKSHLTFDVDYVLTATAVKLRVRAPSSAPVSWSGCANVGYV